MGFTPKWDDLDKTKQFIKISLKCKKYIKISLQKAKNVNLAASKIQKVDKDLGPHNTPMHIIL